MEHRDKIRRLFTNNWKPKYICLILAILLWTWVNHFYVSAETDAAQEWDENAVLFSLPE